MLKQDSARKNKIKTAVCISLTFIMPLVSSCSTKVEKKISKTYVAEKGKTSFDSLEEAKLGLNEEKQKMSGADTSDLK